MRSVVVFSAVCAAFEAPGGSRSRLVALRATDQAASVAIAKEVAVKTKLLKSLEGELDLMLQDATAAEATVRAARAEEAALKRQTEASSSAAEAAAYAAAERLLGPLRGLADAAAQEEESARAATEELILQATADERQAVADETSKAAAARAEAEAVAAATEDELARIARDSERRVSNLETRARNLEKYQARYVSTFAVCLGFAFLAAASLAGDQLHLPGPTVVLFGLAGVVAFVVFGTDVFSTAEPQ